MKQPKTQLKDRQLRFDGAVVISPDYLVDALLRGCPPSRVRLTQLGPDEEAFNLRSDDGDELRLDEDPVHIDLSWQLPTEYLQMDLRESIIQRVGDRLATLSYSDDQHLRAAERVERELAELEARDMVEFFKTVIYILDVFRNQGVIWGVGRGSSCASYILFLLGLHSVDCILYDVPMEEFFHD